MKLNPHSSNKVVNNHRTAKQNINKANILCQTFSKISTNNRFPKSFIEQLQKSNQIHNKNKFLHKNKEENNRRDNSTQ